MQAEAARAGRGPEPSTESLDALAYPVETVTFLETGRSTAIIAHQNREAAIPTVEIDADLGGPGMTHGVGDGLLNGAEYRIYQGRLADLYSLVVGQCDAWEWDARAEGLQGLPQIDRALSALSVDGRTYFGQQGLCKFTRDPQRLDGSTADMTRGEVQVQIQSR